MTPALLAGLITGSSATAENQSVRGQLQGGGGLRGDYYEESTLPALGTSGARKRKDGVIDFDWQGGAPNGTGLVPDREYSARWMGYVHLDAPGDWTFTLTSNEGARLYVDNRLLIDAWLPHTTRDDDATLGVSESGWLPIRVEYYNQNGSGRIGLAFAGPGRTKQVVPPTHLTTAGRLPLPPVQAGPDKILQPKFSSTSLDGSLPSLNKIVSTTWTQVQGPPAVLTHPNNVSTFVIPSGPGPACFELQAVDSSGWIGKDEAFVYSFDGDGVAELTGTLVEWQEVTLTFTHDKTFSETGSDNPFLNYRLQVYFAHPSSGTVHDVPGYFAADGNAGETGATSGDKWRVHFRPDRPGRWLYLASFRNAKDVAVELESHAGTPIAFDGDNGSFFIDPVDPNAPGFLSEGRLRYVGEHHLKFSETERPFFKGGADSPENFLGYYEIDNTVDQGGPSSALVTSGYGDGLHHYDAHLADYVDLGVPLWHGDKGKRIFGAINYLSSMGVNSLYALTFNTSGGDGQEVFPWVEPIKKLNYDVSKLDQWARVFEHMQRAGIALHAILTETENDDTFDTGSGLGRQRKLYYRELVARFGHSLALTWNLGEENSNTSAERKAFYDYLRAVDPYDHPINIHQTHYQLPTSVLPLEGVRLEGLSLQSPFTTAPADLIASLVDRSAASGRPWVVCFDEQNPAESGVLPDSLDYWHDEPRKSALWPTLFAQGGGAEWYFGYNYPNNDLDCEDFRSRDNMWRLTANAVEFARYLHLREMVHADELTTTPAGRVLAQRGESYALYLPVGGEGHLDLEGSTQTFDVEWYDPRAGGALTTGSVLQVAGPGLVSIGMPPPGGDDWVAMVSLTENRSPEVESVTVEPDPFMGDEPLSVQVRTTDPDGLADIASVTLEFTSPTGSVHGPFDAKAVGGKLYTKYVRRLGPIKDGTWTVKATVEDLDGATTTSCTSFEANQGGRNNAGN